MRFFLLVFALTSLAFSAKILDVNTYTNSRYTDIVFSLDSAYTGQVSIKTQGLKTFIFLDQIFTKKPRQISKENRRYKYAKISATKTGALLELRAKKDKLNIKILRSNDKYTLKIKILDAKPIPKELSPVATQNFGNSIPSLNRPVIISAGFVLVFAFLWILVKLFTNKSTPRKDPFAISVEVQKRIDNNNKIIKINVAKTNYIMLIGSTNILLDKFLDPPENKPINFKEMLNKK